MNHLLTSNGELLIYDANVIISLLNSGNGKPVSMPVKNNFELHQNYPNPFNPSTTIEYYVPENSHITLTVYDILGNLVEVLIDKDLQAGRYVSEWHAEKYSSGFYFYRLSAGNFSEVKQMILIK